MDYKSKYLKYKYKYLNLKKKIRVRNIKNQKGGKREDWDPGKVIDRDDGSNSIIYTNDKEEFSNIHITVIDGQVANIKTHVKFTDIHGRHWYYFPNNDNGDGFSFGEDIYHDIADKLRCAWTDYVTI